MPALPYTSLGHVRIETILYAVLAAGLSAGCESHYAKTDTGKDLSVEELSTENLEATSMELRWSSPQPIQAQLRYGIESINENTVIIDGAPSLEHQVRLHFLRPDTEYRFRVELMVNTFVVGSESGSFVTSPVPDELPDLEVTVNLLENPKLILASMMGNVMSPVVISQEGYYAWWHIEQEEGLLAPRARLANDGQSIYYTAYDRGESEEPDAVYTMKRVWLGDGTVDSFDIRLHHHDFDLLPDDSIAWIKGDMRTESDSSYRGDSIVETAPDGVETVIWSSWDHLDFDMDEPCNASENNVWTHANALNYDDEQGLYLLSVRETDSIVAIKRSTGETQWILGGCESDFDFGGTMPFDGQHQNQFLGDSILVYDNQPSLNVSRVVEYGFGENGAGVRKIWSYDADGAYSTKILGDVQRLDSGHTLITWSTAATMEEVDPTGQLHWQAVFGFGTVLGYNTLLE